MVRVPVWGRVLLACGRRSRLLVLTMALAACGSSSGPVTLSVAQSGQTVTVARGAHVTVTLPGTAWQFDLAPPFGPLEELSSHLRSGRTSSETVVFSAQARGDATVRARRTSCGARRCPAGQGEVVFHVVVD